jgi:hypothetical protein
MVVGEELGKEKRSRSGGVGNRAGNMIYTGRRDCRSPPSVQRGTMVSQMGDKRGPPRYEGERVV